MSVVKLPIAGSVPNVDTDGTGGMYPIVEQAGVDQNGNAVRLATNQDITVLASAARTTTTVSASQTNTNARGVVFFFNVTAASGTGGLVVQIQCSDPVSGTWKTINSNPTAVTATGLSIYALYPGIATGIGSQSTPCPLPRTWRIMVQHNDSSSYTYSVGASLIL